MTRTGLDPDRLGQLARSVSGMTVAAIGVGADGDFELAAPSEAGRTPAQIPELALDALRRGEALVAGDLGDGSGPGLRAVAAFPCRSGDGRMLGGLIVADPEPRALEPAMLDALRSLADLIGARLELPAARAELSDSLAAQERIDAVFRAVSEGASAVGDAFFPVFIERLAQTLEVRLAFVAECLDSSKTRVRMKAYWSGGRLVDPVEYDLAGTPCERVLDGEICHYRDEVSRLFPSDLALVRAGARGYLGIPLRSAAGEVIGHLVVVDDAPIDDAAWMQSVLQALGARAAAELERDHADRLRRAAMAELDRARSRAEAEAGYLRDEMARQRGSDEIIGASEPIRRTLRAIEQVAPTDTTVLIAGETGTGKELVARAIHARSARRDQALVSINCGAISPTLVESELFGHEKGSFTGATGRRIGRFELADGGTLFLDEIGDLSADLQVKLLRVLQESEFHRVGGAQPVRVNVRVIAATHRDLSAAVKAGTFRQDLYYRLNVFPIRTPPLRDRLDDLPLLVDHLVRFYGVRLGKRIERIPPNVLEALSRHGWPGNVRELANVIERSVIISTGPTLQLAEWMTGQYQPVAAPGGAAAAGGPASLELMERQYIEEALVRAAWKVSGPGGAAEALGLKPTTLEARMKKLGIRRPKGGAGPDR
ncbi:MAG: sigma-54-dependent Fis family transcriptional regulator [Gemmatimonadales bacterium]